MNRPWDLFLRFLPLADPNSIEDLELLADLLTKTIETESQEPLAGADCAAAA